MSGPGLAMRTGPFHVRIRSPLPHLHATVALLYADHQLVDDDAFCDHSIELAQVGGWRRWIRQQVVLKRDQLSLFEPMPLAQAFPLMEWGLNWCVSSQAHQYLILHAAVLAREGRAVMLPAPPGSGKSTLCAALMLRGWRLLSDELALIDLADGRLVPLARPVSLKNASIQVIRDFHPAAVFSKSIPHTSKGTIAHLKVDAAHQAAIDEKAVGTWIVFPRWQAGAAIALTARDKAGVAVELANNAFNDAVAGREGFQALCAMLDGAQGFDLIYSDLNEAVALFDRLAER